MSERYHDGAHALDIEFVSGGVYRYVDVPAHVYVEFLAAESKGTFVNTVIKPRYRYIRIS